MTEKEFRCFLDLLMCSDPWPVDPNGPESQAVLEELANCNARIRGFEDWHDAFHRFKP